MWIIWDLCSGAAGSYEHNSYNSDISYSTHHLGKLPSAVILDATLSAIQAA